MATDPGPAPFRCTCWSSRCWASALTSTAACNRRARPNALRRTAISKQPGTGCNHAPRPGIRCPGSGRSATGEDSPASLSVAATTRNSADQLSVPRHPTQVRDGSARSPVRSATHQSTASGARRAPPAPAPLLSPRVSTPASATGPWPAPTHRAGMPSGEDANGIRQPWGPCEPCEPATSVSGRMSMRQPVSLAARRAFWPSLPMARLSW
jgi:hypothetical protein